MIDPFFIDYFVNGISKMITKITQANKNGEHAIEIHAP